MVSRFHLKLTTKVFFNFIFRKLKGIIETFENIWVFFKQRKKLKSIFNNLVQNITNKF